MKRIEQIKNEMAECRRIENEARDRTLALAHELNMMEYKPLPLGHGYLYCPDDVKMGAAKLFDRGTCCVLMDPNTEKVVALVYYTYASKKPGTTINYTYCIRDGKYRMLPARYNRESLVRILQFVADKLSKGGA